MLSTSRKCYMTQLGSRKSNWPVNNISDVLLVWLSGVRCRWSALWSSWCHCHPIISCFIKIL